MMCDGTVVMGCTELDVQKPIIDLDAKTVIKSLSDDEHTYFKDGYVHICTEPIQTLFTPEFSIMRTVALIL